jgi:Na+/melibiose symporter-like transporter
MKKETLGTILIIFGTICITTSIIAALFTYSAINAVSELINPMFENFDEIKAQMEDAEKSATELEKFLDGFDTEYYLSNIQAIKTTLGNPLVINMVDDLGFQGSYDAFKSELLKFEDLVKNVSSIKNNVAIATAELEEMNGRMKEYEQIKSNVELGIKVLKGYILLTAIGVTFISSLLIYAGSYILNSKDAPKKTMAKIRAKISGPKKSSKQKTGGNK